MTALSMSNARAVPIRLALATLILAAAAIALLAPPASAAWPPSGFNEASATQNTTFPNTMTTAVTLNAPLPASAPPHPAACDKLTFLRIKHIGGPADPANADKILIAQPGVLEGASAFYNVGANLVTRAKNEHGKYVEFWAVDRRPNCLEDLNGIRLARTTGNVLDLINYYYKGKTYNGSRFAGYLNPFTDAAWLTEMGMTQTLRDWNEIITRALPSQSLRQQKLYCGGHSLGGFLTGAYAEADFDGNSATTADAGYNQCAGFFALDSLISAAPMANSLLGPQLAGLVGDIPDGVVSLMRLGLFERFVSVPGVINPEIMHLLAGLGVAADMKPTTESNLIKNLPTNSNINGAYRFYHSRNLADYLSQAFSPSLKYFRFTNQALLATFTDDNAMPLSIVQSSMGFFKGGPVADKDFPIPGDLPPELQQIHTLLGGPNLAIPTNNGLLGIGAPLYGWTNYNQVGATTIPKNSEGRPYTAAGKEVTDIRDFARSVGALPADFVEKYFPIRLVVDSLFGTGPTAHPGGAGARPSITIVAGDGPNLGGSQTPPGSPVLPGYNHLDVLTAAPVQNGGGPEPTVTNLLGFLY